MKQLNILLFTIIAVLILSLAATIRLSNKYKADKERLFENLQLSQDSSKTYRTRSGQLAAVKQAQSLTLDEFATLRQKDVQTIKDLKIRLKNVKAVIKTEYVVKTEFKEKLVQVNDSVQCFEWSDNYFKFDGCMSADSIVAKAEYKDTLQIFIDNRRTKRFLFIHYGKRKEHVTAISANPNAQFEVEATFVK